MLELGGEKLTRVDLQTVDRWRPLTPPTPFLSRKKWLLYLFGTRPWAEFKLNSWKAISFLRCSTSEFIQREGKLHWELIREEHSHLFCQLDSWLAGCCASRMSSCITWRPAKISWGRAVGLSHSQKTWSHPLTHHESEPQTRDWDGVWAWIESLHSDVFPWDMRPAKPGHVSHFSFC